MKRLAIMALVLALTIPSFAIAEDSEGEANEPSVSTDTNPRGDPRPRDGRGGGTGMQGGRRGGRNQDPCPDGGPGYGDGGGQGGGKNRN